MKVREFVGSVLKLAALIACAYALMKWQFPDSFDSDVLKFAERACTDEAMSRYKLARARPYEIKETNKGYVVRISATLARGKTAKVTCLTNTQGGVRDMTIDEH